MTNTDVAVQQRDTRPPMVVLRERFQDRRGELRNSLPSDVTPDEFIRAAMTSVALNPEILACTWQSIWNACLRACRDGLLPDGVDGALVPYKSTCNWIPMYQGLLRRFRRSGQFKWVKADVVREGDEFIHFVDENGEHFRHVPGDDSDRPVTKAYALATTKEGGIFVSVMTEKEIQKRRAMSRATRDDSPWKLWADEMRKKTMLRQLSKVLPSARDIIPDELDDLPTVEGPASAPHMLNGPRDPTATLDQFASSESAASSPSRTPGDGAGDVGASADPSSTQARPPSSPEDAIATAYALGLAAKAAGHTSKALPGELRDPKRTQEALAWQAGYDGGELPKFKQGE